MGELAAMTLLQRIANPAIACADVLVEPTLIVRESTSAPAAQGDTIAASE
jgi:DNA-binding LacI/PurR family transcriptional regulator